ncbi:DUF4174 domain-containing protein [Thiohalocapsa halophila]|nr:DUF4174 domain-containing protein [Thiohalocapsa halophila]
MAAITQGWLGCGWLGRGVRLALALGIAVSCVGMFTGTAMASGKAPLTALAALRWQHRVIVVDGSVPDAVERLRAAEQAIEERHIVWLVAHPERLQSNYSGPLGEALQRELQRRFFSQSDASVFLIGKDGGLKSSDPDLDLQRLFARIDAMPMRQREMQDTE